MYRISTVGGCRPTFLVLSVIVIMLMLGTVGEEYLKSPCPDIFTYQFDPSSRLIFGYLEIPNLRVGQVVKVNVQLSIAAQLPANTYGSLTLIKSRAQTGKDILKGRPAQYKINFPLKTIIPSVRAISLNGQLICAGSRAQGEILTTIRLEHTLETKFKTKDIVTQSVINEQEPKIAELPPPKIDLRTKEPQSVPMIATTLNKDVCGKPVIQDFIRFSINAQRTEKGQFPWIAPIFYTSQFRGEKPTYICGSTLVTTRHLVTAGHCVFLAEEMIRPERLLTAIGLHNIDDFFEDSAVFSGILRIFPHPNYIDDDSLNEADIALLLLQKVVPITRYIIPLCLWRGDDSLEKVISSEGVVAGWGITESGTTATPKHYTATIVSKQQCSKNLQRPYSRTTRIFCADGKGSSPCNGDSGSGFAIRRGNQYFLRGLVSRGQVDHITLKCDISKFGVYTDIAPFRFWMRDIIG